MWQFQQPQPPMAPIKVKPYPSRAEIDEPESPTKHKNKRVKYTSLKNFFDHMEIIIQK